MGGDLMDLLFFAVLIGLGLPAFGALYVGGELLLARLKRRKDV